MDANLKFLGDICIWICNLEVLKQLLFGNMDKLRIMDTDYTINKADHPSASYISFILLYITISQINIKHWEKIDQGTKVHLLVFPEVVSDRQLWLKSPGKKT